MRPVSHLDDLLDGQPDVLTLGDVAALLHRDRRTIRRAIDAGELPAYRLGPDTGWMILREDLRDTLNRGGGLSTDPRDGR